MENPRLRSVNVPVRDAMIRRLHRRSVVEGKITLPAVPGMIDQYVSMCESLFTSVGRPFAAEQIESGQGGHRGPAGRGLPELAAVEHHHHLRRSRRHDPQPLQLAADYSVFEYEQTHRPEGAWAPTSWYADWVNGRDVFDLPREESPVEMHSLVYQKPAW